MAVPLTLPRRIAQESDLRCCIEAEAKQQTQRVHMRTLANQRKHRTEEAKQQASAIEQQVEVFFAVSLTAPDPTESEIGPTEYKCVDDGYSEKEQRRHERSNDAPDLFCGFDVVLQTESCAGNHDRPEDHDSWNVRART